MNRNHGPSHGGQVRVTANTPGPGDDIACSKCGAVALDTGLECDECGHDMAPEIYANAAQAAHPKEGADQ